MTNNSAKPVGLVPAYEPAFSLAGLVSSLIAMDVFKAIVVVNDGSPAKYESVFLRLESEGCIVLTHRANLGKGAALKTGLAFTQENWPDSIGVVTFDADGQHLSGDIAKVAKKLTESPDRLILGSRSFDGNIPLRSEVGNKLTRAIMAVFCGIKITDSQTGLRGIPQKMFAPLLKQRCNGYEFELEMLLAAKKLAIPIKEIKISTIYEKNNKSSHFNPIFDSIRIYLVFIKFGASSIISAIIDYAIFAICIYSDFNILESIIICRLLSASFNFFVNYNYVFASASNYYYSIFLYTILALFSGILSYVFIDLILITDLNVLLAKLIVESFLFFINFIIQRDLIFKGERS